MAAPPEAPAAEQVVAQRAGQASEVEQAAVPQVERAVVPQVERAAAPQVEQAAAQFPAW